MKSPAHWHWRRSSNDSTATSRICQTTSCTPLLQDLDLSAERLDEVIDWLNDNPAMREVSNEIAIHRRHGRSTDWLLLRLAHRLNPVCPRIWRGVSLDDAAVERNLFELARRAMNGDAEAKALIDRLQQADLSDVYTVKSEVRS